MDAPLFSVISLVTELLVTASVFYIIYRAYHESVFLRGFAFVVLAYEILFNISYMTSRALRHAPEHPQVHHEPFEIALAIFHGTFSLLMFIALVAFFLVAARAYKRGENFFHLHPRLTGIFIGAWTISIFSGVLFFFVLYVN